ncbi:hypothetical protein HFK74_27830|nr:hypothetical protein [Pseudomonas sp. SbOxS1]
MLIYLWRLIQQPVSNNKNIAGLIIMNTENQAWQPPKIAEHQCQLTVLETIKADTTISFRLPGNFIFPLPLKPDLA